MEATPSEGAVKIVKMTTEGLEYWINLVDKVLAVFRLTQILKKILLWEKWYQRAL